MDPAACRDQLAVLLREESAVLERLEALLESEHTVLVDNDIEALARTAEARQSCIGALVRLEDERRSLCRMHGEAPDLGGLERVLAWCDPARTLQQRWAECASRATRCRELNDRNGALVTARMRRVESLLGVLTGRSNREPAVYGREGAHSAAQPGRVLSAEA